MPKGWSFGFNIHNKRFQHIGAMFMALFQKQQEINDAEKDLENKRREARADGMKVWKEAGKLLGLDVPKKSWKAKLLNKDHVMITYMGENPMAPISK